MEEVRKRNRIVDLNEIELLRPGRKPKPKPTTKKPEQLFPVEVKPRRPLGVHSTTSFCSEHDLKVDVLGNCAKCK